MKIKILTNYMNDDLYGISKSFYDDLNFEKIGVNGSNGFFAFNFLNYIITNQYFSDIDIMVYIDEDCFIVNKTALQDLINYVVENNVDCVGMPDGGIVSHRKFNPVAINQYFCILNLRKIREIYNLNDVLQNKYADDLKQYTPFDVLVNSDYVYNDYEPYYKLFFWMIRNGLKFKYLSAYDFPEDEITTVLKNHEGIDFAYHTWYAREWKWNVLHQKERMRKIIEHCKIIIEK
jgi:hypothetical protein